MAGSVFFRQLTELLPDGTAWRAVAKKGLRRLLEGLAEAPAAFRDYADATFADRFPATTRDLAGWERQFGLLPAGDESARRLQLAAAWRAQGGQSPRYLQDVLRTAGFDVYVHEWWQPGTSPRVARDPRSYTTRPRFGSTQCGQPWAQCGEPSAFCNRWLANEPDYLVNRNLTNEAPPPIPDAPSAWPYFVYVGAATFGQRASVPLARRSEFERLLLKLFPVHTWIVTLVNYT